MMAEADRFEHPVSLVLADVDHFKRVNDDHGHDVGDQVLKAVAKAIHAGVRGVDVCARFGGEEIAILLPGTSLTGAVELADRLRKRVSSCRVRVGENELIVTASFGVATYPVPVVRRDDLFGAADRALYEAKRAGRDRVIAAS
jgi:diguanylate cyclase (GGDEF)-like protein